ncbi:DUF3466 family protein [Pseudidiomarina sp.]|uniref:DUF3466 family protein n=1 Tax=Pseudidiomarina sp. TaxID=2081707 RepID=UPI00299F52AC|nr:DUF3466 family protein [Pseudidiomarina sp.]MDX1705010.1 DUF3466 family protein [Pseudidiomarina sp.]
MNKLTLAAVSAAASASFIAAVQADTYNFQELPTPAEVRHLFPLDINEMGLAAVLGRLPENREVDVTRVVNATRSKAGIPLEIDPETFELSYEQYSSLLSLLEDRVNPYLENPRVAFNFAGTYNGQDVTFYDPFNDTDETTPEMADTADHHFYGLNDNNILVGFGTAPYKPLEYQATNADGEATSTITYAERDFTSRAIWHNGTSFKSYAPPEQAHLGGESVMFDINANHVAVGFASVAVAPDSVASIEKCETDVAEPPSTEPLYVCIWELWHAKQRSSATNISGITANRSIYDMRAMRWQLDANGDVISATPLGTLMDRGAEDNGDFSSYAYAVNNNDIAVGQSWTYFRGDDTNVNNRIKMPAVFVGDTVIPVTEEELYIWGSANAINNNNLVTGYLIRTVQGIRRNVGFTYDVDTGTFTELPSFFVGSSMVPNDVNDAGIIVGTAEIEPSLATARRRVGFMYDISNPDAGVINLNDAIQCDTGYFIVSAEGINEQGDIVATALVESNYTDSEGQTKTEQVVKTLLMNPTSGELNDCDVTEQKTERQGASTSLLSVFSMLLIGGLITIRRRFVN